MVIADDDDDDDDDYDDDDDGDDNNIITAYFHCEVNLGSSSNGVYYDCLYFSFT